MSLVTIPLAAPLTSQRPRHPVYADPPDEAREGPHAGDRGERDLRPERETHADPEMVVVNLNRRERRPGADQRQQRPE